ncbi:MAG: flavin reductase family protein, partial [Geodermatophilaceae bacterium]
GRCQNVPVAEAAALFGQEMSDDEAESQPGMPDRHAHARFRAVLGHFPTGVVVVTALDPEGQPVGMSAGTFTSVSLEPPLVGFLAALTSTSYPRIRASGSFCVNVLNADQEPLCRSFAVSGSKKFDGIAWKPAGSGSPLLDGVVAWIDCDIEAVHRAGDHDIVIGRVRDLDVAGVDEPLLVLRGAFGHFAQSSPGAPAQPDLFEP